VPRVRHLLPAALALLGCACAAVQAPAAEPPGPAGVWVTYHPNGAKASEAEHVGGGLVGALRMWDEQGQLLFEGRHDAAGEMHGTWRRWWPSGAPRMRWEMDHGRQHGGVEGWHESGAPRLRGAHRDGARDGAWTWWSADGRVSHACRYDAGRVVEGVCAEPALE
jgi:antitoxin component YwqK of YwqJK toxin-antitoxin module